MPRMNELENKLRTEIDDVYFQPEEKFKPLMHVMEVLAAEIKPFDENASSNESLVPEGPVSTRRPRNGSEDIIAAPPIETDKLKKRNTAMTSDEPIYISVRTLAGKVLPVPSVGPADSVCDVFRSLETTYGVKCEEGKGSAGLYYQGVALLDPLLPLRELPLPPKGATLIIQNHAYETLQRQMHCVDSVVEGFLGAHYNTLSSSVHAIGDVSRQFYGLKERVASLRRQVGDTKQLLTVGMREQPIRELWERKREYTYMLSMMDTLKTIRDAPAVIDSLLERRCYVSAVSQFNTAKHLMFTEEMVPIPALEGVRDQIHSRKSRLLDIIAESVQDLLFSLPKDEFQSLSLDSTGNRGRRVGRGGVGEMNDTSEEGGDRLVAILGRGYTESQVISLEATLNDHVKPDTSSTGSSSQTERGSGDGIDLNHGTSGTVRSDDVALRLQLLLEASHTMQSLGDIQSYVMERTKEGLYRLDRTVRLFVQAKLKVMNPHLYSGRSYMNVNTGGGMGGDEFNMDHTTGTAPLVMFLEHLFHCYLAIINRHLNLCELVHSTKSGHQGGGGGINWLPAEHLWAEIQEHLRELLTNFFSDNILGNDSSPETPSSSLPNSPNSFQTTNDEPSPSNKMLRRNGSKSAYFSFRGKDLVKAGRRENVRLLGEMAGLQNPSFTVVSNGSVKLSQEDSPGALLAKITETSLTMDPLVSFNEDEDFSLCEPDPMHACAVALPLHQFVDTARTSMAHFLPLVDPDYALGAADDFLNDSSCPSPEIDYWLRAVVSQSVLPLMREDASEALDAVLTDRDAFKPSQTFAAATAATAAAEATASMMGSSHNDKNRSSKSHPMRGTSVAAAAGATAATAAAEAAVAKAVANATSAMPPPVCCIEGADAVLGSLLSQVGSLPFHAAPLCDLVEDIAITLVARLKEEGMRLFGSSEAAERISRGGGNLEEMMRKESSLEAFKKHYTNQVFTEQTSSSSDAPNRNSIYNSEPANWHNQNAISDVWELGKKPYILTNDSLITDRRILASLSALAHSAQWLSQRMSKRTLQLLSGGSSTASSVSDSRSRRRGGRDNNGGGVPTLTTSSPIFRRLQAANKHFATYAESLLLVLRMDAVLSTFLFLQQLPESYAKFMRASSQVATNPHNDGVIHNSNGMKTRDEDGTGAMALIRGGAKHTPLHSIHLGPSKNLVVDSCIAALEKHLSLLQRAVLSTAPPAAWAVVVNPISQLAPQIVIQCLSHFPRPQTTVNSFLLAPGASIYDQALPFSERGIDHLLRGVIGSMRQMLIGIGVNHKESTDSVWDDEISRTEHYISLLGLDGVGFEHELRKKPPMFSREQFLVIWCLSGPLRKAGSENDFNIEWEATHG